MKVSEVIEFPEFSGTRCLMMPYIQGDASSLPEQYQNYAEIVNNLVLEPGKIGFLTIDESPIVPGLPHRGAHAKYGRALHTEAGLSPVSVGWGTPGWGRTHNVTLDRDVQVLIGSNVDNSCAVWNAEHLDTSIDGDIGDRADEYPYEEAILLGAGEIYQIGIFTPHESLPVMTDRRQFLRIVSSGVHGRESYFTVNPLVRL